jgi:hypothetical protein
MLIWMTSHKIPSVNMLKIIIEVAIWDTPIIYYI